MKFNQENAMVNPLSCSSETENIAADIRHPPPHCGMRHIALNALHLEACERFYVQLLGFCVEWRPDKDNVYLTSGTDNLALHRGRAGQLSAASALDHFGLILNGEVDVDTWHVFLREHGVEIVKPPKTHRDGARSFYCHDPDGNLVQFIFHPPLVGKV